MFRDDDFIYSKLPTYGKEHVYQACGDWIVIMILPDDLKNNTNEKRKQVLNPKYALFRSRVVLVIDIISSFEIGLKTLKINYNNMMFEVGKQTQSIKYDEKKKHVYANGNIYYYHSIDACFYNRQRAWKPAQAGRILGWHDITGKKHFIGYWQDQKAIFINTWDENGVKCNDDVDI